MMPMGRSRCGFRSSSASEHTESKPMYEKKTKPAPAITPLTPKGISGTQFSGRT